MDSAGPKKDQILGGQPVGARAQDWSFQFKFAQYPGWLPNGYLFWRPPLREPRKYATAALQFLEREQPFPAQVYRHGRLAVAYSRGSELINITLKEY